MGYYCSGRIIYDPDDSLHAVEDGVLEQLEVATPTQLSTYLVALMWRSFAEGPKHQGIEK